MEGRGTNLPRPAGWQSEPETAVARNDRTLLGASVLDHAAEYDKSLQGREMEARREVPRIAGTLHPVRSCRSTSGAAMRLHTNRPWRNQGAGSAAAVQLRVEGAPVDPQQARRGGAVAVCL